MEHLARVLARWVSVFAWLYVAWLLLVFGAAFFAATL